MLTPDAGRHVVFGRAGLDRLVEELISGGYRVIGPTRRDSAIVLGELDSAARLPAGWGVETGPGHYRLRRRDDEAVFGHSAGPQSWKQFLHPPRRQLWSWQRGGEPRAAEQDDPPRYAFLGVRGCDLAAIGTLTRVLSRGQHLDGAFTGARSGLFVVAANCTEPGGACFCASMGTGPAAGPGYDIALTERISPEHCFVAEAGTAEGARVLAGVPHRDPRPGEVAAARAEVAAAGQRMGRAMPAVDLPALIRGSRESPHWQDVASRCLSCANCTMVCPTCFCTTTEDVTDLTGDHAERWQRWASCFELGFSYIHGGTVRESGESRYRQWISHKLGTWHEQFGGSGCTGCGRCIAWCPVGIDITQEAARLAELDDRPETGQP